jgi:hypothetical protein
VPFKLAARPVLVQHDCAAIIKPNNVKRVLADIDADCANCSLYCRRHGVLLLGALAAMRESRLVFVWPKTEIRV